MDYVRLGSQIRRHRKNLNWTQAELASKAGISASFLGHIERGSRVASVDTLNQLARTLDTSIDHLIHSANARREEHDAHRESDDCFAIIRRALNQLEREFDARCSK